MNVLDKIITTKKGNSITKYPSILTYHVMGDRGCLHPVLSEMEYFPKTDDDLYVSEKIDGENTRIIILNDDYILGKREDWLYAKGDRAIPTKMQPIISYLRKIAEKIIESGVLEKDTLYCIYGELHGYKIQKAWKHYTKTETYGFRVFDVWTQDIESFSSWFTNLDENSASRWRENNQQPWLSVQDMDSFCKKTHLERVPYSPCVSIREIGKTLESSYAFLQGYTTTAIHLDDSVRNNVDAEGIVIRTADRRYIAKLRFEDYQRTFKQKNKTK